MRHNKDVSHGRDGDVMDGKRVVPEKEFRNNFFLEYGLVFRRCFCYFI